MNRSLPCAVSPKLKEESGLSHEEIIKQLADHPPRIVGDSTAFAFASGMTGFVQRGENSRFQVDLTPARRTGRRLSPRLLGLAGVVHTGLR